MDEECPITLETIKDKRFTYHGYCYEKVAIKEWLTKNNTDPCSNLELPTKKLFKNIKDIKIDILTEGELNKKYLELREVKINEEFKNYSTYARETFIEGINHPSDIYFSQSPNLEEGIENNQRVDIVNIERPLNSGKGYQFIDLSNSIVIGQTYDQSLFDFCSLYKCEFLNCKFINCSFIGSNLSYTKFVQCEFKGRKLNFYRSYCEGIEFIDCEFDNPNFVDWCNQKFLRF